MGCVPERLKPSVGHLSTQTELTDRDDIPEPVLDYPMIPPPQTLEYQETFTIVVTNVPLREMLFALARDARIDIDIDSGISGRVTLTAIDQTLTQILDRISRQADIRYTLIDELLVVSPDTPYFKNYNVPYLNITRNTSSYVAISTQIASTGTGGSEDDGGIGNDSSTEIRNVSNNQFWPTLIDNIQAILRGGNSSPFDSGSTGMDPGLVDSSDGTSVIANPRFQPLRHTTHLK